MPISQIVDAFTPQALTRCTGVVNASPVGMQGYQCTEHPLDAFPSSIKWVGEVVYTPRSTGFIRLARAQGITCVLGERMWFWQALKSFEFMTGEVISKEVQERWEETAERLLCNREDPKGCG